MISQKTERQVLMLHSFGVQRLQMQHLHGNTKRQLKCSSKVKILRFSGLQKRKTRILLLSHVAICIYVLYAFSLIHFID
jgi:hypothetical protein